MSAVSADPPKTRRSMSQTTCRDACASATRWPLEFDVVALAVPEAQRVGLEALFLGDREHGGGVQSSTQQDDCLLLHDHLPITSQLGVATTVAETTR